MIDFDRAPFESPQLTPSQLAKMKQQRAECEARRAGRPLELPRQFRKAGRRNPLVVKLMAMNRFIDRSARGLKPTSALVWLTLLRDEHDGEVRTSVSDLARRCGIHLTTV